MANNTFPGLGARLRSLRQQRSLTLADVASQTDITLSTISRLESGGRRPSLELLLPLARVYGVTLDELVDAPPTGDPRVHAKPVVHDWATIIPLTQRPGGLRVYKMVVRPAHRRVPTLNTHEGFEWLYVMEGKLRLVLGDQDLVLGPGEVVEFDTRTPHWFGCAERRVVEVLSIFGPQGERMHVRG